MFLLSLLFWNHSAMQSTDCASITKVNKRTDQRRALYHILPLWIESSYRFFQKAAWRSKRNEATAVQSDKLSNQSSATLAKTFAACWCAYLLEAHRGGGGKGVVVGRGLTLYQVIVLSAQGCYWNRRRENTLVSQSFSEDPDKTSLRKYRGCLQPLHIWFNETGQGVERTARCPVSWSLALTELSYSHDLSNKNLANQWHIKLSINTATTWLKTRSFSFPTEQKAVWYKFTQLHADISWLRASRCKNGRTVCQIRNWRSLWHTLARLW